MNLGYKRGLCNEIHPHYQHYDKYRGVNYYIIISEECLY